MLKWVVTAFIGLLLVYGTIGYFYSVALRNSAIIEGRMDLKMAGKDFAEHGYVTNYGSRYRVWLSTNVVSISGTQYQCFITTTNDRFYKEGSLAMTTNQEFIWLDSKRPPKIIGKNYRAQIFPPRF